MGRKPNFTRDEVLQAIRGWLVRRGTPPTVRELKRTLGAGSTRTVLRYLRLLEEHGDIRRWAGARGIKLLRPAKRGLETIPVPLVGEVPAGPLMTAEQNVEGWIRLPREVTKSTPGKLFLLRVRGDSMNKATVHGDRIEDGDLVLVQQQTAAEPGDVVVAYIDGEATIKRLALAGEYFVLRPESRSSTHHPIVVGEGFRNLGVVRRVLKKGSELFGIIQE
jgi:repressor LexA